MTTSPDASIEIRRLRRLLREIADLAQHSSLTGSLQNGAPSAVRRYNAVLSQLEQQGMVPDGLFQPLADGTGFDELGVESALLAGYLKEFTEDTPKPTPSNHNSPVFNIGMNGLKDLEALRDLGKVIREQFGNLAGGQAQSEPEAEASGPATLSEVESRLAEVGAKLQAVAEQLRRDDLTDEQRIELAEQLSRLGQEQAGLARRHAMLREAQAR
jgi:hypothetical protein